MKKMFLKSLKAVIKENYINAIMGEISPLYSKV